MIMMVCYCHAQLNSKWLTANSSNWYKWAQQIRPISSLIALPV